MRACVRPTRQFRALIRRQNRPAPAEPACIFYGRTGPARPPVKPDGQWLRKVATCVRLSVTTGRREKWREKDKTTVGWRAFEVLKPRSWEPNTEGLKPGSWDPGPETSRWGPETQVLRSGSWNLALRAWNPGPETSRWGPETQVLRACVHY